MRQVFDGWGVASKRKVSVIYGSSYDILSAPVATDEYISCVEGLLFTLAMSRAFSQLRPYRCIVTIH